MSVSVNFGAVLTVDGWISLHSFAEDSCDDFDAGLSIRDSVGEVLDELVTSVGGCLSENS